MLTCKIAKAWVFSSNLDALHDPPEVSFLEQHALVRARRSTVAGVKGEINLARFCLCPDF